MQNDRSKNGQPVSVGSTGGSAWIPISNEMPDEEATVLIAYSDGEVSIGYQVAGEWYDADAYAESTAPVTHWMRMPLPPQPNTPVTDAEPSTPANTRAQGPRSV